jgi:hypothetical protein
MPMLRTVTLGSGLPRELWGLVRSTFYGGTMFGSNAAGTTLWDACHVRAPDEGSDGYYFVCGAGVSTSLDKRVLVLSGAGAIEYVQPGDGGTQSPLTGCAANPLGLANHKAVFVGSGSPTVTRSTSMQAALDAVTGYAQNGAWTTGTPLSDWPNRVECHVPGTRMVAFGRIGGAPGSTKRMGSKDFSDNTSSAWTNVTVPDTGLSDGYVKGRIATSGYVMAITSSGHVDLSNTSSPEVSGMVRDTTKSNVRDVDYSINDNQFIVVDGTSVFTAPDGWPSGGPAAWVTRSLPAGVGSPCWCVAMDLPEKFESAREKSLGVRTWYGIGTAITAINQAPGFLLTRDFNRYLAIELSGLRRSAPAVGDVFPNNTYFRFTGSRLFVFNRRGVTVSGELGNRPYVL